jgi:hypothetical protein
MVSSLSNLVNWRLKSIKSEKLRNTFGSEFLKINFKKDEQIKIDFRMGIHVNN